VLRWLTASEGFEVVESEVDLAARRTEIRNAVLATLEEHPGQPTEHVIKRVGKKAGTVREELKKLEIAGTAYRTPSEYTDALGRPRTCSGWFLSAHAGSYAVPLPGTTWDAELSVPVARPAVPHPKGGTGYEGRPTTEAAAAGQESP